MLALQVGVVLQRGVPAPCMGRALERVYGPVVVIVACRIWCGLHARECHAQACACCRREQEDPHALALWVVHTVQRRVRGVVCGVSARAVGGQWGCYRVEE